MSRKTVEQLRLLRMRELDGDDRPPMTQEQYDADYGSQDGSQLDDGARLARKIRDKYLYPCSGVRPFFSSVLGFMPIIDWLPKYDFRNDFASDVIGGLTTGIMHVPQGIAYSILAGVDPVYGLYASCFPAFFYMLFGTSRHTSLGSFAVVALMAGVAHDRVQLAHPGGSILLNSNGTLIEENYDVTAIQITATLTFAMGIWQMLCGALRLQFIMSYFSDPLVSGFTTGAAVHVLLSQIDDMLGISVPKVSGPGYVFVRLYDIFLRVPSANLAAIAISVCSLVFLYVGKEYLSPFLKKKFGLKIPIPYELILVGITSALSAIFSWERDSKIMVVGDIPAGLPVPHLPAFSILKDCLLQSFGIAVVTIAIHISMAKLLAKKLDYTIDTNQELYALGLSSLLGGLFPVYPVSTALGRTMVNVQSGTKTQLSTVFSCSLLLAIIMWLGPLLRGLPKCVLASIITMAVQGMFKKISELKTLWPISKADFCIWLVSFLATWCIDVMEGLAISILVALISVVFRTQWPRWSYHIPETSASVTSSEDGKGAGLPPIGLFRFEGPLIFTNIERFKNCLNHALDEWSGRDQTDTHSVPSVIAIDRPDKLKDSAPRFFVLDFASVSYIDFMGINTLKEVSKDIAELGLTLYISGTNGDVRAVMEASGFYSFVSKDRLFPTLRDAVAIARRNTNALHMLTSAKNDQISRLLQSDSAPEGMAPLQVSPSSAIVRLSSPSPRSRDHK